MSQRTIIFSSPEDVLNFVRTVEKYPYDMDLESGRAVVDAKSLLGLMNLGLNKEIELKVYDARICLMKFQSTLQRKQSSGYL